MECIEFRILVVRIRIDLSGLCIAITANNLAVAIGVALGMAAALKMSDEADLAEAGFEGFLIGSLLLLAIGIIVSFFRQLAPGDRLSALALGLILGGAVGNLIDRIWRGEVVDFLHFKLWQGYSWPDFNLADSFIVVGVAILILDMVASEGEERAAPEADESST